MPSFAHVLGSMRLMMLHILNMIQTYANRLATICGMTGSLLVV
jgi:hypothetical protein